MRIAASATSLTAGYSQGEDKFPYGAILQKFLDKECGKGKHEVIRAATTARRRCRWPSATR